VPPQKVKEVELKSEYNPEQESNVATYEGANGELLRSNSQENQSDEEEDVALGQTGFQNTLAEVNEFFDAPDFSYATSYQSLHRHGDDEEELQGCLSQSGANDVAVSKDTKHPVQSDYELHEIRELLTRERGFGPRDDLVFVISELISENVVLKNDNEDLMSKVEQLARINESLIETIENQKRVMEAGEIGPQPALSMLPEDEMLSAETFGGVEHLKLTLLDVLESRDRSNSFMSIEIDDLKKRNEKLLDEMAILRETSTDAYQLHEHKLTELRLQVEDYEKLSEERDIACQELDGTNLVLQELELERHRRKTELDKIHRDNKEIQASLLRQGIIVAEKDENYMKLKQSYQDCQAQNADLGQELQLLKAHIELIQTEIRIGKASEHATKSPDSRFERHISVLRVEIKDLRQQLETGTLETGDLIEKKNECMVDAFGFEGEKRELEDKLQHLTNQLMDRDRQLIVQRDELSCRFKVTDDERMNENKLLTQENERFVRDLQETRTQLMDLEKKYSDAVQSNEIALKKLYEALDESIALKASIKIEMAGKERQLNKLVAENAYLNSTIEQLKMLTVSPAAKSIEPVHLEHTIALKSLSKINSSVNNNGIELNNNSNYGANGGVEVPIGFGDDNELEQRWQQVEKTPAVNKSNKKSSFNSALATTKETTDSGMLGTELTGKKNGFEEYDMACETVQPNLTARNNNLHGSETDVEFQKVQYNNRQLKIQVVELQKNIDKLEKANSDKERKLTELYGQVSEYGTVSVEKDIIFRALENAKLELETTKSKLRIAESQLLTARIEEEREFLPKSNLSNELKTNERSIQRVKFLENEMTQLNANNENLAMDIQSEYMRTNGTAAPDDCSVDTLKGVIEAMTRELELVRRTHENKRIELKSELDWVRESEEKHRSESEMLKREKHSLQIELGSISSKHAEQQERMTNEIDDLRAKVCNLEYVYDMQFWLEFVDNAHLISFKRLSLFDICKLFNIFFQFFLNI